MLALVGRNPYSRRCHAPARKVLSCTGTYHVGRLARGQRLASWRVTRLLYPLVNRTFALGGHFCRERSLRKRSGRRARRGIPASSHWRCGSSEHPGGDRTCQRVGPYHTGKRRRHRFTSLRCIGRIRRAPILVEYRVGRDAEARLILVDDKAAFSFHDNGGGKRFLTSRELAHERSFERNR